MAGQLTASADGAATSLERGNETAAAGQLNAFIKQVQAEVRAGRMSAATGAELLAYAQRVLQAIGH